MSKQKNRPTPGVGQGTSNDDRQRQIAGQDSVLPGTCPVGGCDTLNNREDNNTDIKLYMSGQTYSDFALGHDIVQVDMDNSGLTAHIGFCQPSAEEVRSFGPNESLRVRLVQIHDVTFFLFRFGSLPWMDAPFNVNLAKRLTEIPDIPDGFGISLMIFFFDSFCGKLLSVRHLGLPTSFSRKFVDIMKETKNDSFDAAAYMRRVSSIQSRYSTQELVKMSLCSASFG